MATPNKPEPVPTKSEPAPVAELSFSDLVPSRQPRSLYPHLKTLEGTRIKIIDLGHDGADDKTGFYCVIEDGTRYSIPMTIAKKLQIGLKNAAAKGQKYIPASVQGLERGVRLS